MVKENGQKKNLYQRNKKTEFLLSFGKFPKKKKIQSVIKKKKKKGQREDEGREKKMCKRSSRDCTRNFGEASGEIAGEIQSRIERMGRNHRIKVFHRETQSVSEIFTSRTSENRFILKRKKIQWSRFKKYVGFCKWNHTCFSMSTH